MARQRPRAWMPLLPAVRGQITQVHDPTLPAVLQDIAKLLTRMIMSSTGIIGGAKIHPSGTGTATELCVWAIISPRTVQVLLIGAVNH